MSWLTFGLGQVFVTTMVLGALKRQGAITIEPSAIQNDIARKVLVSAVDAGEDLATRIERIYHDLTSSTK